MSKNINNWLANIYYVGTLITLFFIVVQVFLAKQAMVESSEWEKAKVTIENVERFKEKLKETTLYDRTDILIYADKLWPDCSKPENYRKMDPLCGLYVLSFDDPLERKKDTDKSIAILNAFAYPIIMGYASEMGSYENASFEFYDYGNVIMPLVFEGYPKIGLHAKLLYKLWRIRHEQQVTEQIDLNNNEHIKFLTEDIDNLLCFEGTEFTPATLKQYEKKLEKELKKAQEEIEEFRKNSLK